jgi:K+-transporting ATPase KdpF subunit
MTLMYVVVGLITLLLLVYLFVALLKPEKFG